MTETVIHVVGHVGTDVDLRVVGNDTPVSSFRLATTPRRWDKHKRAFVDEATTWLTVECWRTLAEHVHQSVRRGDQVIVVGKLRTHEWVKDRERRSRVRLDAIAVGHDLTRGTAIFIKRPPPDGIRRSLPRACATPDLVDGDEGGPDLAAASSSEAPTAVERRPVTDLADAS
jgi:single-strand DNA-binding protein